MCDFSMFGYETRVQNVVHLELPFYFRFFSGRLQRNKREQTILS